MFVELVLRRLNIFIIVGVILFFVSLIPATETQNTRIHNKDFKLQPGDIILTKGPVLFGFFGHSSIAIDHDTVLQIEGPGDKPIVESFESFKHRFGDGKNDWIKFYRSVKPGAGIKAAQWAKAHYKDSDKTYLVTLNLKSENYTYCTKIIYQAYKYGVSDNAINDQGLKIISPYALVDNFSKDYRLKLVYDY